MSGAGRNASHWQVRTYLFWLVLACLLPGVIGAVILFTAQYQEGRAQQEKDTIRTVRALVEALDSHLLRGQAVAQALATRDALVHRDFARFHESARELLLSKKLGANIVLRDASGTPLLNTHVPFGAPLPAPSPERVRGVFTTGKPVISDLFIGDVLQRPIISVYVPVIIGDKIAYALSIGFDPEQFNALLRAQKLPPGWIAAMFDSSGAIVGRNISPEKFIGHKASDTLRAAMTKSPEGAVTSFSREGTLVRTFYSVSPDSKWRVAIGIPMNALRNELLQRLAQLAVGVALLFALGMVLARYMSQRIADSVKALIAPAMALGAGDSVQIPSVHLREAAEVADGIQRAAQLQHERAEVLRKQDEALRLSEANAQRAARQAEARRQQLDVVLEATLVGLVLVDDNGALLHSNAANRRLWGEHPPAAGSALACAAWKGWWADHSERHGQQLAPEDWPISRALRGEEVAGDFVEIEPFDAPTVRRVVLVSAAPVRNGDGEIIGGVTAQMDITDRIRAEEALRQADRRKDEFLAMLAHELRNPLAPIAAAAELLDLGTLEPWRLAQVSDIIARQVRHMTGLINDLLDVSRVTRGLVRLENRVLDARSIAADAVEQVMPLTNARQQQLIVRVPAEPACVIGDPKRLVQVLTNLLNNAAKFTPAGGRIDLDLAAEGDRLKIAVTDDGVGLAPELTGHAFELFAQGERDLDRSQGGLGIGLALVRSLVELHGGTVEAHSDGIGKGSCFTVWLPMVMCDPGAATANSGKGMTAGPPSDPLKVLVVDDNADAAKMLAMFVESSGHKVVVEHDPIAALESAQVLLPDVCLLDIGLPGMDGNELARRLRAGRLTGKSVLVAVTGYGEDSVREQAFAAGFDHHLVKPVDPVRLNEILAGATAVTD